jgi:hypothetical protein
VSVALQIFIWSKDYQENWSAFAPDFKVPPHCCRRRPCTRGDVVKSIPAHTRHSARALLAMLPISAAFP